MDTGILSASVPVTLDGRDFVLRYRAYAFIAYAESCGGDLMADIGALGHSMTAAGADGGAGIGAAFGKMRDVLWAGLIDAQPDITRQEVARLFGLRELGDVSQAITAALQKSLPETPAERPTRPARTTRNGRDTTPDGGRDSGPIIAPVPALQPQSSDT